MSASTAFSTVLTASGGDGPPYDWYLDSGTLVAGLSIDNDGTLHGTPTATGAYDFTIGVYDNTYNNYATQRFTGTVGSGLTATTTAVVSNNNPSTFNSNVQFTATVNGGTSPTGTITFKDGASAICSNVAMSGTSATCSTSSLSVGGHTITAVYSGDSSNQGSSSPGLTQTVNKLTTTTAVVSNSNPSTFGGSVQFTATISGGSSPSGTVTFNDGASAICSGVGVSGAQATCSTSSLTVGGHTITAVYTGDGNNNGSTSPGLSQTVNKTTTTTGVVSNNNPSEFSQSVQFTATISGGSSPTGTVTFNDGASAICSAVAVSGAQATCSTSSLTVGGHTITAVYTGDGNNNGSTSPGLSQTVDKASTTTTVGSDINPSVSGQSVTFTATVGGGSSPGGSVSFFDGATLIGSSSLSGGQATLAISSLSVTTHSITAVYGGDSNNQGSTSGTLSQVVNQATTATSVSSGNNPSEFGQSVTFTATVSGGNGPTGTVEFFDGATSLGTGTLAGGQATVSTSALSVTTHTITAVYTGDSNNAGSTSVGITQTVNQATSGASVSSDNNPSTFGGNVTFTATVNGVSPTGSVEFFDGATSLGTGTLNGSFQATVTTSALTVGGHTITAVYAGDTNNAGSTSPGITQTVNQITTTTAVTADINPSTFGQTVTFTATVTPGSLGPATGTVTFSIDSTPQVPTALVGGVAVLSTAALTAGPHSIDAVYSGDTNFQTSTATTFTQNVDRVPTTTTLASTANPSILGQTVVFTATVSGSSGRSPVGSVTFSVDGSAQPAVTLSGGTAAFSTSALTLGTHTIDAVYSGDTTNAVSSASLNQTVNQLVTATTLTSSANPSVFGSPVTFTIRVRSSGAVPTGSVVFAVDRTVRARLTLSGSGTASVTTSALTPGTHAIDVAYAGDTSHAVSAAPTLAQAVNQIGTTTALVSSLNPSNLGDSVTFTATVTPSSGGAPGGSVTFLIDGATRPAVALSGTKATLTTASLAAGDHVIGAIYGGDANHGGSTAPTVSQKVLSLASVVIAEHTDGADGFFGFTSPTSSLNLSIATSGGNGQSSPIALPTGTYQVTAKNMSADGFALNGISCNDSDSSGTVATATAHIVLAPGEQVVCTFSSLNSRSKATQVITSFMETRGSIILNNQPDPDHDIDRLNGGTGTQDMQSNLMALAPLANGGSPTATVSTSLSAMRALTGNTTPNRFDVWFQGTLGAFDKTGADGSFDVAFAGADYLVTKNLLLGGIFQFDNVDQDSTVDASHISGAGWMVGPYATLRFLDHLYFDIRAEAGRSTNWVSPFGTYTDSVEGTRWLVNASLTGQWTTGAWTLEPGVRVSTFQETTDAYTDSMGVGVPGATVGLTELALTPALSYTFLVGDGVTVVAGTRLSGIADFDYDGKTVKYSGLQGQVRGTLDLSLPSGPRFGGAVDVGAQADGSFRFISGTVKATLPIN